MPPSNPQRALFRALRPADPAAAGPATVPTPIEEAASPRVVRRRETLYRRLLVSADVFAALAGLGLIVGLAEGVWPRPLGVLVAIGSLVFVNKLSRLYDRDELVLNRSTLDELPKLGQISALFALTTWLLHKSVTTAFLSQQDVLYLWLVVFAGLALGRMGAREAARRLTPPERCLIVGDRILAERVADKLRESHARAEVTGTLPLDTLEGAGLSDPHAFELYLRRLGVQRLIVAHSDAGGEATLHVVRAAKAAGLNVSLLPRLLEVVGSAVELDQLDGLTVLGVRRFGLSRSSRAIKRALDLAGATLGLLAVAPVFVLVALLIRLDSRGPALFRQTRVGQDGDPFEIVKFRTMVTDAEALKDALRERNEAEGLFKIADDPRITRVGRLLRKTSLDELPQLLNVLAGQMSLVGPRPLIEEEDALVLGHDRSRLHLTPGMTGPWQILGSRIPMQEMVAIDYLYVANWSLWNDVKILLRTVRHVVARRGL